MKNADLYIITSSSDELWEFIRFFRPNELWCPCCKQLKVASELLTKLDRLRDFVGEPLVITSGYRCPEHNKKVGGKPTSSHLSGLAVDIAVPTSSLRYKLLSGALMHGFRRIGVGKDFVHLDIDLEKPQDVVWTY